MSSPHFLGRHGRWDDQLEGFSPNEEAHKSYAIIDPISGISVDQRARSQSNMVLPRLVGFREEINRFSNFVVPLVWMEYVSFQDFIGKQLVTILFSAHAEIDAGNSQSDVLRSQCVASISLCSSHTLFVPGNSMFLLCHYEIVPGPDEKLFQILDQGAVLLYGESESQKWW